MTNHNIYYYGLTITAQGASTEAYYSTSLESNGGFINGGATFVPTETASSMVSLYAKSFALNAPAGSISGAVTVATGDDRVAGGILVSPPVNVDTAITLYGAGGTIGTFTLRAGESKGAYEFHVESSQSLGESGAQAFVERSVPKK